MDFISEGNPKASALYLVDRGMQGKWYRWFDADTNKWGMCGFDMNEALDNKDGKDILGFFPWCGPLTGPKFVPESPVHIVEDEKPTKTTKVAKQSKRLAKQTGSKLVKSNTKVSTKSNTKVLKPAKSVTTKVTHPDGTVFFREDRQKWIAMMNGKQEAARPTIEACLAFLKKKYNVDGVVIK